MNQAISDWNDEYANGAYIAGSEAMPALWQAAALAWREKMQQSNRCQLDVAYGSKERQRYDVFEPAGSRQGIAPKGTIVFVHGGYWKSTDKSFWSHLAKGPVAHGWRVIIPGYTLCPENTIAGITLEIANCLAQCCQENNLPLRLCGHSAGGHLVTRMVCDNAPLLKTIRQRIEKVVSISGVHDLRPLLQTSMKETLKLDETMAVTESPALQRPVEGTALCCYVGADERPEFIRQNALLANIWRGLGASSIAIEEPGKHHFSVIDALADSETALTSLLAGDSA